MKLNLIKYWLHFVMKGYPPYKYVNGMKVRLTGPRSVNRDDAIRANWHIIRKLCGK